MTSPEALQRPLLPTYTDDKVDNKGEPAVPSGQPPPSYQAASEGSPADAEPDQSKCCRRRRCRRFGHFFIALLVLWLAARYVVRHCELRKFAHPLADGFPWRPPHGHHPEHGENGPRPGEHIDTCVDSADWAEFDPTDKWYTYGFEAWQRAELSLPSSADDIFLFSTGSQGGYVHLVEAPGRDDIGVEVTVGSDKDSSGLSKGTKLCTLRRGKDGHGVGIFTHPFKRHSPDHDSLFFNITISLPKGKDVTTIPHFETRLPKYTHVITALEKHAFGSISLHSYDSPIYVWGLVGDKINIRTRNGAVHGSFNTSSALEIKTANSPIGVAINAFNSDNHAPTKVKLRTSNSYIYSELALLSTPESQSNGSFFVCAHTSNSPLTVNFTEHAANAQLNLQAHTSNAYAGVFLQPAFEGTFKSRTSIFPPWVPPADIDADDPAGLGRKRVVDVKTVGHGSRIVYGNAAWVPQDKEALPGRVEVSTSNSPLTLSL